MVDRSRHSSFNRSAIRNLGGRMKSLTTSVRQNIFLFSSTGEIEFAPYGIFCFLTMHSPISCSCSSNMLTICFSKADEQN